jgi:hypothetical protein
LLRISRAVPASWTLDTTWAARALALVCCLRFEQFDVGEDDTQLIVQAVEEHPQVGRSRL